ncbi:MAG: hypothetical protein KF684_09475 [Phycisphaeraceae bacterium]|nr:hypothetical protein [Phycisphaeraceae bacterium]
MVRTHRTVLGSLAALVGLAGATAAVGGITPSFCFPLNNGNFNLGFAFWSPDVELGEFGDTSTNALVSATPLGFLPAQGNIATFFTEASADWECLTPNGSAASSTVVLSRTVLSATAPTLRFRYGAQYSFLVARGGLVEYSLVAVLTNRTTGQMIKCPLARDRRSSVTGQEGILQVPFTTFTSCNCTGNNFIQPGNEIEVEVVFSVRADGRPTDSISFIGGPGYADDFEFCNILCLEPIDPVEKADNMMTAAPVATFRDFGPIAADVSGDDLRLALFDIDGDGVITPEEIMERINANEVVNLTLSPADLNADGVVDHADLEIMMRVMVTPDANNPLLGDVNADGVVDRADVSAILELMR